MFRLFFLLIFLPNLLLAQIEYSSNEYNNLWSIAIEVKKNNPDFSLYQIMIAIQDLNPDSFKQGNINFLKKDQLLETPDFYLLDIYDRYQSIRDVAEQNSIIDSKYTDYVALQDVLVLTEPTYSLSEPIENIDYLSTESISIENFEDSLIIEEGDSSEEVITSNNIESSDSESYVNVTSNSAESLQESLAEIDSTSSIDFQLILIVGLAFLLIVLGILYVRSSPANFSNEKKNEDNLDEEYEEIGDPFETRLNLATMYIEMKNFDEAKILIKEIIDNAEDESVVNKAKDLLKNFNEN